MAFFAKFRRKLRTKNFEAHFYRKLRTLEKCSNVKKLRTTEPQPIFSGSYKKKVLKGGGCRVRSSLQALVAWVSLVCMVELRWIGRFLVKMVGSGSAGQVRFSRLDWVR